MTTFSRESLTQAAFWGEAVCLSCGATQTEVAAGENCQECEAPNTVPASVVLQFVNQLEENDD